MKTYSENLLAAMQQQLAKVKSETSDPVQYAEEAIRGCCFQLGKT